jgi:hypothetical protein
LLRAGRRTTYLAALNQDNRAPEYNNKNRADRAGLQRLPRHEMRTGQRALLARGRKKPCTEIRAARTTKSVERLGSRQEMNHADQVHKPSRTEGPVGVEIQAGGEAVGKAKRDHEQVAPPVIGVEILGRLPWGAVKH